MSFKFGLGGMVNNSLGGSLGNTGDISIPKEGMVCKVEDIILDENHPSYSKYLGFSQLGSIICKERGKDGTINPKTYNAQPSTPNLKNFPIIGEDIRVYSIPSSNSGIPKYIYDSLSPISQYGVQSPHSNQSPLPTVSLKPTSQQLSYEDVSDLNVVNIKNDEIGEEINIINSPNPSQNTFIERGNIHPLMYYNGDILYEGRWGQSIRFGSTTKSKSKIQNNYSSIGNNGDPILVIRNGQDRLAGSFGANPIVENIKNDLSSIYLTSTQKLEKFKVAGSENYSAFPSNTQPIPPSLFTSPQIAINSDRVVINAQKDNILLSAEKSISLSVGSSVGITTPSFYVGSNTIRLGGNDAKEPILKGNVTVELLKSLTDSLDKLAQILEVETNWPEGKPVTSNNSIASNVRTTLNGLLNQLDLDEGREDSLKSFTSKVK
tara:strand:+ start:2118 stop:3419 length:1302 start_codon:yes stop_codon:yes gene_type:complete